MGSSRMWSLISVLSSGMLSGLVKAVSSFGALSAR